MVWLVLLALLELYNLAVVESVVAGACVVVSGLSLFPGGMPLPTRLANHRAPSAVV